VPTALDRIVQRALSKDPVSRFRAADQLGRILIAYKEEGQEATSGLQPVNNILASISSTPAPPGVDTPSGAAPGYNPGTEPTLAPNASQPVYMDDSRRNYPMPPEPAIMHSRGYRAPEPEAVDVVTLLLAIIALVAVLGVVILWIFVWQAYSG
jgi:hypothetical protein